MQIKNGNGSSRTVRSRPWRNRSRAISVRMTNRYPSISGRRLNETLARPRTAATAMNPAFPLPARSVARPSDQERARATRGRSEQRLEST